MKERVFYDQIPDAQEVRFSYGGRGAEKNAKNYVIYCRESDEDRDRTKSIPAQVEQCFHVAEREGVNLLGHIREKKSARQPNRPKFQNLIAAIKDDEPLVCMEEGRTKERPDGIIAWHPDRISRNWRDSAEVIELLDDGLLTDMKFVMYSFHNDSSGKEHLAMEFARAKGYSDHLQDNVIRGLIEQELKGKGTKPLHPAFEVIRKKNTTDSDHLKIVPSKWHRHWRDVFRWRLEGKTYKQIAEDLIADGYAPTHIRGGTEKSTAVDSDHIGRHIENPLCYGMWMTAKETEFKRKVNLCEVYRGTYGAEFPCLVTEAEFKKVNPECFSDTATKPKEQVRHTGKYALSGKVFCKHQLKLKTTATLTGNKPKGGSGKQSPRYSCQRCKPTHSVDTDTILKAVGKEIGKIKLTEEEHKKFVIAYWHRYEVQRADRRYSKKSIREMKRRNEEELEEAEGILNKMQYGNKPASQKRITTQKRQVARLQEEAQSLDEREMKLTKEGIEQFFVLDAFLELSKNASKWWKKATEEQKRKTAEIVLSNVIVEGNEVATVSLAEPFATWAKSRTTRTSKTRHSNGKRSKRKTASENVEEVVDFLEKGSNFSETESGGADGTRTRDLLRDREAL